MNPETVDCAAKSLPGGERGAYSGLPTLWRKAAATRTYAGDARPREGAPARTAAPVESVVVMEIVPEVVEAGRPRPSAT